MIRLLLVDDSPLFCAQFRGLARWESCGIVIQDEARNGKNAIECIHREPPDIILTDISMPVMDGIGLIEYVHSHYPQIPVIALSAYDDFDYVRGSLRNGACDYILKHKLDVEQLTELIRSAVRTPPEQPAGTEDPAYSRREFFALAMNGWYADAEDIARRMEKLKIVFPPDGCIPVLAGPDPREGGEKEFTEPMIQLLLECLNRRIWEYLLLKSDLLLLMIPASGSGQADSRISEVLKAAAVTVERFFGTSLSFCAGNVCRDMLLLSAGTAEIREQYVTLRSLGRTGFISVHSGYNEYVRQIMDYIRGHYSGRISLRDISLSVGLSESYVSRIFKSETGVNIVTYINDFRLDEAARLLRQTSLPIKLIADRVGIENYNRFFNLFRERMGCTPRAYRDGQTGTE